MVDIILSTDDEFTIEALNELLQGLIDQRGDVEIYNAAQEAARYAFTFTKAFQRAFEEYSTGGKTSSDVEADDDRPAS